MDFLIRHHNIGQYTGYKTRVLSEFFYELKTEVELPRLHEIYTFALEKHLPVLFLSWGTNMLFSEDIFPWIVVKNSLSWWYFDIDTKHLSTASWELIWNIAETLELSYNEPIWHRFIGLPGAISWAVVGNAGCFGLETASNFLRATVYDMKTRERSVFTKDEMQFDYRSSILKEQKDLFLVSAEFDLSEKREKYASGVDNIDFRENKQPKWYSCGSFFKNPSREVSAWSLIEQVWLKWYRHGGARWSELHANFLLSDGESCRPSDLIELVRMTQSRVREETGYKLVNEVRIIE